ncbi:hypothetical protein DY000_02001955, partial [Brassica cretica]
MAPNVAIEHDSYSTSDDKKPPVSASGFAIPKAFTLRQHRVKIKDGVRRFYEEDLELKKSYFSRELSKRFLYYSNFNLYSSPPINWRDNFAFYMDPNPPKPEELPEACRNEVLEYSKHVMSLGGLLFELLSEALGLSSEILKSMGCMKGG